MSIHRRDLPNAPYRIRKSSVAPRWIWVHVACRRGGRAPTREQAAASAAVHATTEHGASLDHFRSLMPALRKLGIFGANSGVPNGAEFETMLTDREPYEGFTRERLNQWTDEPPRRFKARYGREVDSQR